MEEASDLVASCAAGTAAINDCMAQIAPTGLKFDGAGVSGFGAYRGKASIDTFSHLQPAVTVTTVPEFDALLGRRYPQAESLETVEFVKNAMEARM